MQMHKDLHNSETKKDTHKPKKRTKHSNNHNINT